MNTLVASGADTAQLTDAIRAHDAKRRHIPTASSIHPVADRGWVLDSPGIRTLHLGELADGPDAVFAEITEPATHCKSRNCTHLPAGLRRSR